MHEVNMNCFLQRREVDHIVASGHSIDIVPEDGERAASSIPAASTNGAHPDAAAKAAEQRKGVLHAGHAIWTCSTVQCAVSAHNNCPQHVVPYKQVHYSIVNAQL
jgi:hypothetical protein